jgi:hypothetical protein
MVLSQNRLEAEYHRLWEFRESLTNFDELPVLTEKVKEFIGISTTSSAFSNNVLRVEISGPTQQHFTIVDLPSLIYSKNKLQTSTDIALVLSIVQLYMANRRSIVLAVVSAKNNYANQIVTKRCRFKRPLDTGHYSQAWYSSSWLGERTSVRRPCTKSGRWVPTGMARS